MCFEFGSCFGNSTREDYGGELSALKPARRGRRAEHRNGGYYSGTDNKVPMTPAYPHQQHAKNGHRTYHAGAENDHHDMAVGEAGGHGRYAAYVPDRAEYDNPKLPAWHNKVRVGDDAGYTYTYTPRFTDAASDHKEKDGMDYHHYPTITTNLVRY